MLGFPISLLSAWFSFPPFFGGILKGWGLGFLVIAIAIICLFVSLVGRCSLVASCRLQGRLGFWVWASTFEPQNTGAALVPCFDTQLGPLYHNAPSNLFRGFRYYQQGTLPSRSRNGAFKTISTTPHLEIFSRTHRDKALTFSSFTRSLD